MILLLLFAFISGLVTILAPCIWPLLPIILSSSLGGGKAKSLGITFGIMLSFTIFTLSISYLVTLFGFDPNVLRFAAVVILIFLGLTMVLPPLSRIVELGVSRLSGKLQMGNTRSGFAGGFITGLALGIVWTPCAGPILAAIATLAATSQVNLGIILVTIVYVIGVGIPLFFFSYSGQKLITNTRFLSRYTGRIQQVFGLILLLTALTIATNYDKVLQAKLLDFFPQYSNLLVNFESNPKVLEELNKLKNITSTPQKNEDKSAIMPGKQKAPDFLGITQWLNSESLTMDRLKGKVVLVDFWTYSCINCIRTLPYVTSWYEKYKDMGFVVVGVHSPEFEFEKSTPNVDQAIKRHKITYPVAQDNEFLTWRAYDNHYWPAKYLIDKDGYIRYMHFGEGKYEETERMIQMLLKEKGESVKTSVTKVKEQQAQDIQTPEIYLGSKRLQYYANEENITGEKQRFLRPTYQPLHSFALNGEWTMSGEAVICEKGSQLTLSFHAENVYLVATPKGGNDSLSLSLDGRDIGENIAGEDVRESKVVLDESRLYDLIDLHGQRGSYVLDITCGQQDTQLFALTFG